MRNILLGIAAAALLSSPAAAKMVEQRIGYEIDDKKFEGMLVYDDGVKAKRPGVFMVPDWEGVSPKSVDQAIFSLPPNRLSQIIESDRGFHIVRVLERKEAGRTSFADAQGEIKKKMKDEIKDKEIKKYLDELKMKTPVWTIYDDKPGGLEGLPQPRPESNF